MLLENSVPVQTCNGIALHLPLQGMIEIILFHPLWQFLCSHSGCTVAVLILKKNMFKEGRCSGIWRMILKWIYDNLGVCIGSSWL